MIGGNTLLEIKNIRKEFPGVVAVNDVSFDIQKGEVHIVIGENGAGKSTLGKILAGLYSIGGGQLILDGNSYFPKNVVEAQKLGVNMIHQELSMMSNRTVAQNMFVGRESVKKGILNLVDTKKMNLECKKHLSRLNIDIDPTSLVKDLSIAQQQMVEVAKAMTTNNKLIIMDEPTSSLTQTEIENLFRITRQLKDDGVSIIYISHRMQELIQIGDRVTILRDGCHIGTYKMSEITMPDLIAKMVGRKIENVYCRKRTKTGNAVLSTKDLTGLRFRDVSIEVKSGEIVGLAGLVGAGRTELAKAIFGYDKILDGSLTLFGKEMTPAEQNTTKSVAAGVSFLPEDRKGEGLLINMPIKDNIVMACLSRISKYGITNAKVEKGIAEHFIKELQIKTTSVEKKVINLSGGNQQKVVLAKWLATKSQFFIFDEPTRGIDVGARAEIYQLMNELTQNGAGILMISSDMPELIGLSDRIYVMKDGEISGEISHDDVKFCQEGILEYAIK